MAAKGARASGTPFISFFTPAEMLALARDAGFREARHVSAAELAERYFKDRPEACARRSTPRNCWSRRRSLSLGRATPVARLLVDRELPARS